MAPAITQHMLHTLLTQAVTVTVSRGPLPLEADDDCASPLVWLRAQGRDKDCILISFVRSNDGESAGALLADWRRINVAITRARQKLVLIGSGSTLRSVPMLRHLLDLVQQRNMYIQLPTSAFA